jgi:hypothetical protein
MPPPPADGIVHCSCLDVYLPCLQLVISYRTSALAPVRWTSFKPLTVLRHVHILPLVPAVPVSVHTAAPSPGIPIRLITRLPCCLHALRALPDGLRPLAARPRLLESVMLRCIAASLLECAPVGCTDHRTKIDPPWLPLQPVLQ